MGILREFWFNLKIVTEMMEDFCRQWVWNPTTSPQLHSLQSKTNQVSNYFQRQPMLVDLKITLPEIKSHVLYIHFYLYLHLSPGYSRVVFLLELH